MNRQKRKLDQKRRRNSCLRKKTQKKDFLDVEDWIEKSIQEINNIARKQWQNNRVSSCEECRACCYSLRIEDEKISKPAYQWCKKMTKQGCLDYPNRPICCKGWFCFWALNMLGKSLAFRPDKCGILVFIDAESIEENQIKIIPVISSKFGTLESSNEAKKLINEMIKNKRKTTITIHYHNEKDEKDPEKIKYVAFEPDDRNVQI